jgi:hypothetical protein
MNMDINTDIVKRNSIAEMVMKYGQVLEQVKNGFEVLRQAKATLADIADRPELQNHERNHSEPDYTPEYFEECKKHIKREVWRGLVQKLNIRSVMNTTKRDELDKQLSTGEGLPEIETEAILQIIGGMMGNIQQYARDAIIEAFELMRRKSDGYKSTGEAWMIENKVVLGWMIEGKYGGGYHSGYSKGSDAMRTIENAFLMLDGKGPGQNYKSDLEAKIGESTTGEGETEYFRFRCHKNRNLHLWFKRADLVTEMNKTAGGAAVLNKAAA